MMPALRNLIAFLAERLVDELEAPIGMCPWCGQPLHRGPCENDEMRVVPCKLTVEVRK